MASEEGNEVSEFTLMSQLELDSTEDLKLISVLGVGTEPFLGVRTSGGRCVGI